MTLKRPVTLPQARRWPAAAARRESFCARMGGMRAKLTGERAARDPRSAINQALAAWDCDEPELLQAKHVSKGIRPMKITTKMVGAEARKNPAQKVEIIERATLPNGRMLRLQKRAGKFDATMNTTGINWHFIAKGVSEAEARRVYDYWRTMKNPRKPREKVEPFPSKLEGYGPRKGLEGPFLMRNGRVVYYDPAEGAYYDPTTDFYLTSDEASGLHSNPRRKPTVSRKISQLTREGYPQKQAVAIALSEQRAGKVRANPAMAKLYTVHAATGDGKPKYPIAHFRKRSDALTYAKAYAKAYGAPVVLTSKAL